MAEAPSSPPGTEAPPEAALSWYKAQYEQLEQDLSEVQAASKEIEAELERELDAADKRERVLQEKAEGLSFEVEEWKRKCKESKAEANAAQNGLEKEVTTLRDAHRGLQMKLRDIEVANDDFERQARNTTSSLEDLESKYNVAIERAVMMEEEIKIGEQEREHLRVEAQRLREELSDLKIEADILQDKIKKHEARHLSAISTDLSSIPDSPTSTASSPLVTTPHDARSTSDTVSEIPPSPPMSDASAPLPLPRLPVAKTPLSSAGPRRSRLPSADSSVTPRPRSLASSTSSASGRPRIATASTATTLRTPAPRTSTTKVSSAKPPPLPPTSTSRTAPRTASGRAAPSSLTQIRSLTAQMQRLEKRVHSVRSKLPAPVNTPPHPSPRTSAATLNNAIPAGGISSSVTLRTRKRTVGSAASSTYGDDTPTAPNYGSSDFRSSLNSGRSHVPRPSMSGSVSRLSFGPLPNRNPGDGAADGYSLRDSYSSRPSSRASASAGYIPRPTSRTDSYASMVPPPRPVSRTAGGARTPLSRPRSSLGGSFYGGAPVETDEEGDSILEGVEMPTPSRRGTYNRAELEAGRSAIPAPARRQSGGAPPGRRSSSTGVGRLTDVGETY